MLKEPTQQTQTDRNPQRAGAKSKYDRYPAVIRVPPLCSDSPEVLDFVRELNLADILEPVNEMLLKVSKEEKSGKLLRVGFEEEFIKWLLPNADDWERSRFPQKVAEWATALLNAIDSENDDKLRELLANDGKLTRFEKCTMTYCHWRMPNGGGKVAASLTSTPTEQHATERSRFREKAAELSPSLAKVLGVSLFTYSLWPSRAHASADIVLRAKVPLAVVATVIAGYAIYLLGLAPKLSFHLACEGIDSLA